MSRRVVTKEDVQAAKQGVLEIGPDDLVTEAALEASAREGVSIVRKGEAAPPPREARSPAAPAAGKEAFDPFAPGSAALSATDGTPAAIVTAVGKNRPFVLAE